MKLKIMSYNILCYGPDNMDWTIRHPMVTDLIRREQPDSFGVQEAHFDWMQTLSASLPEYDYVGVGREDGKNEGEFSAVFYLKNKFTVVDSGTFWLSETPDVAGSKGWDGACHRVCSWAKLKEKESGEIYVHMNTHLDHRGDEARTKGLQLLLDFAKDISEKIVLTGDFNFFEGCDLYKQMTSGRLVDSKFVAADTMDSVTYNAFYPLLNDKDDPAVIDFINVSDDIKVNKYRVLTDRPDGKFPSDHYPVMAEIEI